MATEISASLAEVISALDPAKIPDKLHCPHCDGFLLNGYKLSCCDQSICENCYPKFVSDRCFVCDHQPFTQELCKPNGGLRKTAKAFLKTQEKKLAEERAKTQAVATPAENPKVADVPQEQEPEDESAAAAPGGPTSTEDSKAEGTKVTSSELPAADDPQPSVESVNGSAQPDAPMTDRESDEHDVTIETTSTQTPAPAATPASESKLPVENPQPISIAGDSSFKNNANGGADTNFNGFPNMLSMNAGVNIMDPAQMMQFMSTNGMNGFNAMMGMPNMGMNQMPQGMFGGFGGPGMAMNGTNGINMGMNFNPTAGMFGASWNGQNNNMWNGPQSNNPNAFPSGIGGDFGSNSGYGYNMSQSANFHQQQQPLQGEFGYYGRGPRGRGRGRGGFNRNRNSFNSFSQANQPHFQNAHEQQQYEIQHMQAQMLNDQNGQPVASVERSEPKINGDTQTQPIDDDEFAPGGQEEVQEALGADYHKSQGDEYQEPELATEAIVLASIEGSTHVGNHTDAGDTTPLVDEKPEAIKRVPVMPITNGVVMDVPEELPHTGIIREETKPSMPPPTAPSGPSGQHREPEDFGFRARGPGKYPSRNRGSFSGINGPPVSPMKASPQSSNLSPSDTKPVIIPGAPTGPRAMREPPVRPARPLSGNLGNTGGFKIMGRASMVSQDNEPRPPQKSRSNTPVNIDKNHGPEPRSTSRQQSRHSGQDTSRHDTEPNDDHDRDRDRDHDRDRKRSRKPRRDDNDDYEMQDTEHQRSRSLTPSDRKSSHRSRRDKDHHSSSRRDRSRSRRKTDGDKNADFDDYGVATRSSKDGAEHESRSSHRGHRSSKASKHDDREREDRHRDRDRKRSRHDRDHEDVAEDEEVSRHRSRRHKREHRDESATNGNGAGSRSHRSSEAVTPVESEKEKDPHTLEREARNRERMAKEMQRRENAAKGDRESGGAAAAKRRDGGGSGRISGGRRVSVRYEGDLNHSTAETERESARWR